MRTRRSQGGGRIGGALVRPRSAGSTRRSLSGSRSQATLVDVLNRGSHPSPHPSPHLPGALSLAIVGPATLAKSASTGVLPQGRGRPVDPPLPAGNPAGVLSPLPDAATTAAAAAAATAANGSMAGGGLRGKLQGKDSNKTPLLGKKSGRGRTGGGSGGHGSKQGRLGKKGRKRGMPISRSARSSAAGSSTTRSLAAKLRATAFEQRNNENLVATADGAQLRLQQPFQESNAASVSAAAAAATGRPQDDDGAAAATAAGGSGHGTGHLPGFRSGLVAAEVAFRQRLAALPPADDPAPVDTVLQASAAIVDNELAEVAELYAATDPDLQRQESMDRERLSVHRDLFSALVDHDAVKAHLLVALRDFYDDHIARLGQRLRAALRRERAALAAANAAAIAEMQSQPVVSRQQQQQQQQQQQPPPPPLSPPPLTWSHTIHYWHKTMERHFHIK